MGFIYLGIFITVALIFIFAKSTNKNGVYQDVEVLSDDRYKIITNVYLKGDLIKKMEKVTKGADAEKVVKEQREKGKNHYKLIKRFSK